MSIASEISDILASAKIHGDFCVSGTLELSLPVMEIEDIGRISLPLSDAQAQSVITACEQAPFGHGSNLVVDTDVRRCWQTDASKVSIGGRGWTRKLNAIIERVKDGMGIQGNVEAHLYKVLVYEKGGFFLGHKDTEKEHGMFGTLILTMPGDFRGGELIVRHQGQERKIDLRASDPSEFTYAAFYADCVHEVLPLESGTRFALVYNLIRQGRGKTVPSPETGKVMPELEFMFKEWSASSDGPSKIMHVLDHEYTSAEIGFGGLKGKDIGIASMLSSVGDRCGFSVYLGLMEAHQIGQDNGDGDFDEEGDIETKITVSSLVDQNGEPCILPKVGIDIDSDEVSPPDIFDGLEPSDEEAEGYMGNYPGNIDRTYTKAALVMWPKSALNELACEAGYGAQRLEQLVQEASVSPENEKAARDMARRCVDTMEWGWQTYRQEASLEAMRSILKSLRLLGDRTLTETFLTEKVSPLGGHPNINDAIIETLGILTPKQSQTIIDAIAGKSTPVIAAEFLERALAVWKNLDTDEAMRRIASSVANGKGTQPSAVCSVLRFLAQHSADMTSVFVNGLLAHKSDYDTVEVLAPALSKILSEIPQQKLTNWHGYAALEELRNACLLDIEKRILLASPPTDMRRSPNGLIPETEDAKSFVAFLADPVAKTWTLEKKSVDRNLIMRMVKKYSIDVTCHEERTPFRLVCTKNMNSFERQSEHLRNLKVLKKSLVAS